MFQISLAFLKFCADLRLFLVTYILKDETEESQQHFESDRCRASRFISHHDTFYNPPIFLKFNWILILISLWLLMANQMHCLEVDFESVHTLWWLPCPEDFSVSCDHALLKH